jgi:putative addiction module component (TIGR02574 family)
MPVTIDMNPLLALPAAERLEIANALYASVPEDELPPGEISEELKQHLDRRLQEIEDNPDAEVTLDESKRRLAARRAS